jgi:hypothetical protein
VCLQVSNENPNIETTLVWLLKPQIFWSLQSALKATDTARPPVSVDTTTQIYITRGEAEHSTEHVSERSFHTSGKRSA